MKIEPLRDEDRKALETMHVQVNKTGDGLVAYTLDRRPLLEDKMNAAQKEAIRRFSAIHFPPKAKVADAKADRTDDKKPSDLSTGQPTNPTTPTTT